MGLTWCFGDGVRRYGDGIMRRIIIEYTRFLIVAFPSPSLLLSLSSTRIFSENTTVFTLFFSEQRVEHPPSVLLQAGFFAPGSNPGCLWCPVLHPKPQPPEDHHYHSQWNGDGPVDPKEARYVDGIVVEVKQAGAEEGGNKGAGQEKRC